MEFMDFEDVICLEEGKFSDITSDANETKTFDELCDEVLRLSGACDNKVEIEFLRADKQNVSKQHNKEVSKKTHGVRRSDSQIAQTSPTQLEKVCHPELKSKHARSSIGIHEQIKSGFNTLPADEHKKHLLTVHDKDDFKRDIANKEDHCAHCGAERRYMSKNIKDQSTSKNLQSISKHQQTPPIEKEEAKNKLIQLTTGINARNISIKEDECNITTVLPNNYESSPSSVECKTLADKDDSTTQVAMINTDIKCEDSVIKRSLNIPRKMFFHVDKYKEKTGILSKDLNETLSQQSCDQETSLSNIKINEKNRKLKVPTPKFSNDEKSSVSSTTSGNSIFRRSKRVLCVSSQRIIKSAKESSTREVAFEADCKEIAFKRSISSDGSVISNKLMSDCTIEILNRKDSNNNLNVTESRGKKLYEDNDINIDDELAEENSSVCGDHLLLHSVKKDPCISSSKYILPTQEVRNAVKAMEVSDNVHVRKEETISVISIGKESNQIFQVPSESHLSITPSLMKLNESTFSYSKHNTRKETKPVVSNNNPYQLPVAKFSDSIDETENISCMIKKNTPRKENEDQGTIPEKLKEIENNKARVIIKLPDNIVTDSKNINTRKQLECEFSSQQEEVKVINTTSTKEKRNAFNTDYLNNDVEIIAVYRNINNSVQTNVKKLERNERDNEAHLTRQVPSMVTPDIKRTLESQDSLQVVSSEVEETSLNSSDSKRECSMPKDLQTACNLKTSTLVSPKARVTKLVLANSTNDTETTIEVVTSATTSKVFQDPFGKSKPILSREKIQNSDNSIRAYSQNVDDEPCKNSSTSDLISKKSERYQTISDKEVLYPRIVNTFSFVGDTIIMSDNFTNAHNEVQIVLPLPEKINERTSLQEKQDERTKCFPPINIKDSSVSFDTNISNLNNTVDRKIAVLSRRRGAARVMPFTKTARTINLEICHLPVEEKIGTQPIARFQTGVETMCFPKRETYDKIQKDVNFEKDEIDIIDTNEDLILSSKCHDNEKSSNKINPSINPLQTNDLPPSMVSNSDKPVPSVLLNTKNSNKTRKRAAESQEDSYIFSLKKPKLEEEKLDLADLGVAKTPQSSECQNVQNVEFQKIFSITTRSGDAVVSKSRGSNKTEPNHIPKTITIHNEKQKHEEITPHRESNSKLRLSASEESSQEDLKLSTGTSNIEKSKLISETSSNLFDDKTIKTLVFAPEKSDPSSSLSVKTKIPAFKGKSAPVESHRILRSPSKCGRFGFVKNLECQPGLTESAKKLKIETIRNPVKMVTRNPARQIQRITKSEIEANKTLSHQPPTSEARIPRSKDKAVSSTSSVVCIKAGGEIVSAPQKSSSAEGGSKEAKVSATEDTSVDSSAVRRGLRRLRRMTVPIATATPTILPTTTPSPAPTLIPTPNPTSPIPTQTPTSRFLRRRVLRPSLPAAPTTSST